MVKIPEGWIETTLKSVCVKAEDKINVSDLTNETYISTENMLVDKGGITTATTLPTITNVSKFFPGDILFSNIRTYFKKLYLSNFTGGCSNDVLIFRANKETDNKFLFYNLSQDTFFDYTVKTSKGTKMPRGDKNAIEKFGILLPTLPEQKAIAGVLSAFDDKIELLRAENQTLEEMGQTLFKERFPHNNPCIRFGDFVEVKRGGSPRPIQDFISDTGYRRLKISDATAETSPYIFNIKERIKESGLKKTVHLDAGSLILSNSATPGIPKILAVDSCIHDGWLYFPKSKFSKEFLYLLFLTIRPDLLAQGSGSVFTNLKTDILKGYLLPDYGKESLDNFQKIIEPIFQKIKTNSEEIESLSKTRDQLLPKLMSGEVRVEF